MMGLYSDFTPKHARKYANLAPVMTDALADYIREVRNQSFPSEDESFTLSPEVLAELAGDPNVAAQAEL